MEEGKDKADKAGQKEQWSRADRAEVGHCKLTELLLPEPAMKVSEAEETLRDAKRTDEEGRIDPEAIVNDKRPSLPMKLY